MQANEVISGAIKTLRKKGLDKSARHATIAPEDIARLYNSGAFLVMTSPTLQNKVFFEVSIH